MIRLSADDFTVEVSGSITLLELDTELARYGQTSLLYGPANYSINQILLENWGHSCHHAVLGLSIKHQGINTKCGGQVIKNVSGYDLAKLYIGSRGNYGQITSAYLRTIKLASEQITYNCPEGFWDLDLSHWQNCSLSLQTPHTSLQAPNASLRVQRSNPSTEITIWGETDLLELRASKLEKLINNYQKEKSNYQKQYLDTRSRIELNTSLSSLKYLYDEICCAHNEQNDKMIEEIIALPKYTAIYIYSENPETILEKIKKLNQLFTATLYPTTLDNQRLEQYYNAGNPDEKRILEKLYAKFN